MNCILDNNDLPSICLINARSGRSYIGVYQDDQILLEDQIMKNDEVLNYIEEHPDYSCAKYEGYTLSGTMCIKDITTTDEKPADSDDPTYNCDKYDG